MSGEPEFVVRKAQVSFDWADGHYTFRLPIGQLVELQELTDAGPAWIDARLKTSSWFVKDITETIRLGLIGGGVDPNQAKKLVERYVAARPLNESVPVAQLVISAVLIGVKDEALPKSEGEEPTENPPRLFPEEKSASSNSTAEARPSTTRRGKRTTTASGN